MNAMLIGAELFRRSYLADAMIDRPVTADFYPPHQIDTDEINPLSPKERMAARHCNQAAPLFYIALLQIPPPVGF
jgi:hypothetical protein